MCGIIGINSQTAVAERILASLERLEYRGYDSAGLAVIDHQGALRRCRAAGKLGNLIERYQQSPIDGYIGIGHTRWATHGLPTEANAHPHGTEAIAVVHNGIIENFPALKAELTAEGSAIDWQSETDTEVVVHMLARLLQRHRDPKQAMSRLLSRLEGAFALVVLLRDHEKLMLVARRGSPMAIAQTDNGTLVGSDAMALAGLSERICYLRDGEWAILARQDIQLFDAASAPIEPEWHDMPQTRQRFGQENFPHAMLREIHEQPGVIGDTLNSLINPKTLQITGNTPKSLYKNASMIQFCACGTAFYATQVAAYWFETLCRLPVRGEIASELRYRSICAMPDALGIFVSQSGETMDTMQAMQHWQGLGAKAVAIVNVPQSSLARAADHTLHTLAGPEQGVASTKAFTTQLTALYCLALWAAQQRGRLAAEEMRTMVTDLLELPTKISQCLGMTPIYQQVARDILAEASGVFFLGRGTLYPVALEGALKLKEITYRHAEGYAAGEMKHGPIALVCEALPVVFLAPHDSLITKTMSNIREIVARGGRVILISDQQGLDLAFEQGLRENITPITMPRVPELLQPILYAIPVQMLAYETAAVLGREIDQPRNLAKSVTVE